MNPKIEYDLKKLRILMLVIFPFVVIVQLYLNSIIAINVTSIKNWSMHQVYHLLHEREIFYLLWNNESPHNGHNNNDQSIGLS